MKTNFFLFLLVIWSNSLIAQEQRFSFRDINTADGLSNNNVSSIVQDKLGQMWFATSNGLNKYNGKEFTVYRNVPGKINSISSSEILNLLVDKDGFLWAGTFNGLNKYDPKTNTFQRFHRRPRVKYSLSHSLVRCSLEMPDGSIWFGTENGVSIYQKKENKFIRFLNSDLKVGFKSINHMVLDHNKNVWLATSNGIIKVERNQSKKYDVKEYNNDQINFFVNSILEISPDVIGIATKYNGYLIFNTKTKKFSRPNKINIPENIDVRSITKDNEKNLWLGTTSGLFIVTAKNKETIYIQENRKNSYGTIENFIRTIYKDENGTMWLGTQNGGVFNWDKSYENFLHYKNQNLYNNITNSIVADNKGLIYFATEGGGINTLDKKGRIAKLFEIESLEKNIVHPIISLYYQNPNLLFIGTLNKGIIVYDVKAKKIRDDIISTKLKKYINTTNIYDIKKDSKDNLYLGTFTKGLLKYNLKNKTLQVFDKKTLATKIIKTIYIDKDDNLLVGGIGGATALTFHENGDIVAKNYLNKKQFKTFNINVIYKDSQDKIWVGTTTRGLYKLDGDTFKKVFFSRRNMFSNVSSILEGDRGILWLSTDKGIVKYNTLKKISTTYSQREALSNNDFRQNSSLKINNQIYFGDRNGLTSFNTKNILKNTNVSKVVLSELKIKNEIVSITNDKGVLSKSLNFTDQLKLNHKNSNFSISYALPNYINSKENRYAYRLKGLDDAWTNTKQTEAFFTLQTSGKYTFQVKAANHDGVWNKKITNLKIIVLPAPWKTWWAYSIYFVLLFFFLYGLSWILQSKSRLKNKLELESIANKRNIELNKTKLQFFTNISHEFRTPLTLIIGPLQNILSNYSGSNETYKKLKIIESSTEHLLRLINRLMDFRKLESNQFQLEAAEGNIVKFLHEIFLSFSEHAKNGNYNYKFSTSSDEILVFYDRYKLERVFYNLISNAFRYTNQGGDVFVKMRQEKDKVFIEVQDSGVGISEEYKDKIFDRFFEVAVHKKTEGNFVKGTGIGLSIAKNIVKLHRGEIFVENRKPNGTKFSVALQLGKTHLSDKEILKNFKTSDDVSQYVSQINTPKLDFIKEVEGFTMTPKKYTILIVEDNAVLRSFIKEILKPNYNIIQAKNGRVALEKAIKYLPDLIISDVVMPEMVGTEMCSKIKTTLATSHIPVILLTSRTSFVYKFEGLESGADDYITKPFNLKEFTLKIKNILDSKQRLKDKFMTNSNFKSLDISLTSLDQKLLNKAFKVVKENISNQDFNIEKFSEDLGVSRSMLFTKIKAWANSTPNEFVQEIRLNHAAKLLEFDKFSISEVSYEVGFKRSKYFSQCFKKKYGLTPTEYSEKFKINS